MSKEFVEDVVCKMKFDVDLNTEGTIYQPGDVKGGKKSFTYGGFKSDITVEETVNCESSPALHNGIAAFMWLFTGHDDIFDEYSVKKSSVEEIEDV